MNENEISDCEEKWEHHLKNIIRPAIMETEKDLRGKSESVRIKETISIEDDEGTPVIKGISLRISVPMKSGKGLKEHEIRFFPRSKKEINVSYSGISGLEEHEIDFGSLNRSTIREELKRFSTKILE